MDQTRIDQIDRMLLDKKFNGVVLIAHQADFQWTKGYGYADFELDVLNTAQTKFRIASITKTFTAAAILQLLEKG
ncbi:MAG: serine hydrolase, partial [Bacillota bacterium]|nr:serine hydrolase [Bacillota bacterium]